MQVKALSHALSDKGKVRASNQDSGYSGYNLFFVADGMGGHAGGDIASALVAQNLAQIDRPFANIEDAREQLVTGLLDANRKLHQTVKEHSELSGMGTTFSGLAMVGNQMVVAHIGDSRIYLVREGEVSQITADHTFVQRLVDLGRITPEEALIHPRRSVLMRVLGDVEENPEIDTLVITTQPGDRWLLCSDGLSGVVPEAVVNNLLLAKSSATETTELLVGEALEFGAYDNVTVVMLDIVGRQVASEVQSEPVFVGSAANPIVFMKSSEKRLLRIFNTKLLSNLLLHDEPDSEFAVESDEYLDYIMSQTHRKIRHRKIRQAGIWSLVLIGLIAGISAGYAYTQTRYYVGESDGKIAIYQGISEKLGPLTFSHLVKKTSHSTSELNDFNLDLLKHTIPANDLKDAERIVNTIVGN